MMELAREALTDDGYSVLGGYLSLVNDKHDKKGLAPANHRIAMCQLAVADSPYLMVDSWEVQVEELVRDFGVVCVSRNEGYVRALVKEVDALDKHRKNIVVVDAYIKNDISSSKIRRNVARKLSIRYLTPSEVIDHINEHDLYK